MSTESRERTSPLDALLRFCLERKLVVFLLAAVIGVWSVINAPFAWDDVPFPRDPVPVDAIPDLGENQQIVFTNWPGRSPRDVEDQLTYPLTVALLGIPGVKTVRSYSMFGFSTIYVIFDEDTEFYWSRSRLLEKLASLSTGSLPEGVRPKLGPDATGLGQVFWYTLEPRDPEGVPTGGWGLGELRSIQDWYVRYALQSAEGVSEVASVGGYVREYQVDVDPDAMRVHGVTLDQLIRAVQRSNVDVGARTIEVNRVEYVIRGLGRIEGLADVEEAAVAVRDNVPILVGDVARVTFGPAQRRGALDNGGVEAVGGVVVSRYGYNPLEAIRHVKEKIEEISPGLPAKAVFDWDRTDRDVLEGFALERGFTAFAGGVPDPESWLEWLRANPREEWPDGVTLSQVTIQPFYDRAGLIQETLGTLGTALFEEILVTVLVVVIMLMHLRSSLLISMLLPLAVGICFIAMKQAGVQANIVALSGIAIAIGTMVDMGVILCENILRHLNRADPEEDRLEVIHRAASEVGGAVLTAVSTTVISFLPVFTMTAAEGKLFKPLAYTKTFALLASVVVALTLIPPAAHLLFRRESSDVRRRRLFGLGLVLAGLALPFAYGALFHGNPRPGGAGLMLGVVLLVIGVWRITQDLLPRALQRCGPWILNAAVVAFLLVRLSSFWSPLGPDAGEGRNLLFVGVMVGGVLLVFLLFQRFYTRILRVLLDHQALFLLLPTGVVLLGLCSWLGFDKVFGFVPRALGVEETTIVESDFWKDASETFPGLGKEFMPPLDEGSFLYMPTTAAHASIGEALDVLQDQDRAMASIPEVVSVVGKIGRAESPLDPAPVSMVETVIHYKSEYGLDEEGNRVRQWREHIHTPDDIWDEIVEAAQIPGTTSAPKLQPIATRIVMLQSGMRAPMGVKVKGPDLETIERVGIRIESLLREVPGVSPMTVTADRLVGKPYLEIEVDRQAIARHGLHVSQVQGELEAAIGGRAVTWALEGRERYPVRIRYQRELRDDFENLERALVATPGGAQIPLAELAELRYVRGPQSIKSEDTFLIGYVVFDKVAGAAEVDVVETAEAYLQQAILDGELTIPAGVSFSFAGNYENQVRSQRTLALVLPLALLLIFAILYFQFERVSTTLIVFSGILVAWSGGFLLVWAYGRSGFLDFEVLGTNLAELFRVHPINLSVAIWVGFLALFGIATDDGVVISTYLDQTFAGQQPRSPAQVRDLVVEAASRRIRPALMTSATTILALIPVLTSRGRGADIMVPMAIPSFGGMCVVMLSVLVTPVLYCAVRERRLRR